MLCRQVLEKNSTFFATFQNYIVNFFLILHRSEDILLLVGHRQIPTKNHSTLIENFLGKCLKQVPEM